MHCATGDKQRMQRLRLIFNPPSRPLATIHDHLSTYTITKTSQRMFVTNIFKFQCVDGVGLRVEALRWNKWLWVEEILSLPTRAPPPSNAHSLIVSKRRHPLSDKSTHAAPILSSWVDVEGPVPEEEVMEHLREINSRFAKRIHEDSQVPVGDPQVLSRDTTDPWHQF
ncbi:hypothetical protein BD410DRAFT_810735 [Rickenella mellea]|uniref:Uncharacterized protein n=1 Tax=Rickenella mellea TaxID=50990 RepID=A0A4Y7PFH3_9AGAM|nr:hypothetical protein BD410DRAFT_810735 [Rickenella mellea]